MKLSILMPVYNEEKWIAVIVRKVLEQDVPGIGEKELIVVNDCSRDGTAKILENLQAPPPHTLKIIEHDSNKGKGAAIRTAIGHMTGDVALIQDADLEYDPENYPLVLEPILAGRADCVYGSRFTGTQAKRVLFFWHYVGNQFLTLLSNMFTNLNLTDMETGCKAFRAEILRSIPIRSQCFGLEPEITAKIARRKLRIFEVGISYNGRTYQDGKKITWVDGFKAIYTMVKYRITSDAEFADSAAGGAAG